MLLLFDVVMCACVRDVVGCIGGTRRRGTRRQDAELRRRQNVPRLFHEASAAVAAPCPACSRQVALSTATATRLCLVVVDTTRPAAVN